MGKKKLTNFLFQSQISSQSKIKKNTILMALEKKTSISFIILFFVFIAKDHKKIIVSSYLLFLGK